MKFFFERIWGQKIRTETAQYLRDISRNVIDQSHNRADQLIQRLAQIGGPSVLIGETQWGAPVRVPLEQFTKAYSLVTGGTGSGKTCFALNLAKAIFDRLPVSKAGFGVLDPKGDLFAGALFLLMARLHELDAKEPQAAEELRRRVVIYDFGCYDPLSSYNVLAPWPDVEAEFFASNRAEMLLDLLPSSDKLSLGGAALLQKMLLLLSEFQLPITYIDHAFADQHLLNRLLGETKNEPLKSYFARQFAAVPKSTITALRRRLDALFATSSVRLALGGDTAPDFRRYMDEGRIILVSCFGQSINRSVRRVLQGLVLSDIRQAVFGRRQPERTFLWACDEAQNFFLSSNLRNDMSDLLSMSRSFGSFFLYLTQNMSTAVNDPRMLKVLYTNIRWSFSMRGEPSDCEFLKSALPITGRRTRPRTNPFEPATFCTVAEERGLLLDEVANLPDRVGYLWLKTHSSEAIPIRTAHVAVPPGRDLEAAISPMRRDANIGGRVSKTTYESLITQRDANWLESPPSFEPSMTAGLTERYRRMHGKE
jgi:hypothetical protein